MRRPAISCCRDRKSLWELYRASNIVATPIEPAVEIKKTMAGRTGAGADEEQRERYIILGAGGERNP